MKVSIIGLGLIGGSLAIELRKNKLADYILGVENNKKHAEVALVRGLVDEVVSLEHAVQNSDLVLLAVSADVTKVLLPKLLDLTTHQIVMDVCSIKRNICELVATHPKRKNYISTHPMAGTENSGPNAAIEGLFEGKVVVFVESERSNQQARDLAAKMYEKLDMRIIYMDAKAHDRHAAYVSHISHVSSMALALTVLEKEKNEENIFDLASGGFDSTVRLAKSSSQMWTPIFLENSDNILAVLEEYIYQLTEFKSVIENTDESKMELLITNANGINKILK